MSSLKKNSKKKQAYKPKAAKATGSAAAVPAAAKKAGSKAAPKAIPEPLKAKPAGTKATSKPAKTKAAKPKASKLKPKPAKPKASKPKPAKPRDSKAAKPKPSKTKAVKSSKAKPQKPATKKPTTAAAQATSKAALLKERAAQKAAKDREREKLQREKDQERALRDKEREKAQLLKEKASQKAVKDREREKLQREKDQERALRDKEREKARLVKEKAAEQARQAKAREAAKLEAEREREAQNKAKEAERLRVKADQAAEKLRIQEEKDQAREEARRLKDDERKAKDDEREAYRLAKETERDRLRAERQTAKRLLEVKVARAQRRANRGAAGRGGTRVYRPDAVPNQDGTTRRQDTLAALQSMQSKFANLRTPEQLLAERAGKAAAGQPLFELEIPKPPPAPPMALSATIEERYAQIQERLARQPNAFKHDYSESFDMSWIYHDSALEGVVYTFQELKTAIDPNIAVVPDSSLQPVCEEIRRHKAAIELVRDLAEKKRVPITMDTVKKIYVTLHPEEGDIKSVKYRKDIPQHRLYFHEYAQPDKIALKIRQAIDWLGSPESKKIKSPVRIASRVHYDLLRIFPFPHDSGKVARLLMNLLLLRAGHPPAIIHSTERQKYYEALKGSLPTIVNMVTDAISNGLASVEKLLDERVTPTTAGVPSATADADTDTDTPRGDAEASPGSTAKSADGSVESGGESPDSEDADETTSFDDEPEDDSAFDQD